MNHAEAMRTLARRALQHLGNGTTDLAESTMPIPLEAYIDESRYRLEVERIFRHLPLAVALSAEVPEPGSYRAMKVLDLPLLIVRGRDLQVRAFLNVCRHRGSTLCREGSGKVRVLTCPYHAWTYDDHGRLLRITKETTFGEVDRKTMSLTPLFCAERAGLVWVGLTPGEVHDIDEWLGDFAAELATLKLESWHLYEQRDIAGPGWKVTMDGYLEAYHHDSVHGATVGKHTVGNLLVLDTFGPHQRMTFARRSLSELNGIAEPDWEPERHIRLIHSGFPNLSISGVLNDHCLVSQIFPGPTPDRTVTRQSILAARRPATETEQAAARTFSEMVLQAVRDEDYAIGFGIQAALKSGANSEFVLGRNEPAVQNYHRWVARLMRGASAV